MGIIESLAKVIYIAEQYNSVKGERGKGKGQGFKYIRPALKIGHWAEVHTPYPNRIER